MASLVATLQDNINKPNNNDSITNYSYWLGGTDTTNAALQQYDLARTGYGRIFILRMPAYVQFLLPDETKKVKHLLQFANTGIDGIQGYTVDFTSITVGYVGNTVELPINVKDDTSAITIKIYETQGRVIGSYIDFWITGTIDPFTGLSHYHGAREQGGNEAKTMFMSQANQTMEALYVSTDPTGENPEYCCLLTNMFPKSSDHSAYVYEAGSHDLIQLSLEFTASKYMSSQINYIGCQALKRFNILRNYLNMYSGYKASDIQKLDGVHINNWNPDNYNKGYAQKGYDYSKAKFGVDL